MLDVKNMTSRDLSDELSRIDGALAHIPSDHKHAPALIADAQEIISEFGCRGERIPARSFGAR